MKRTAKTQRWVQNDNPNNWAEFHNGENPRTMKSVHAWFFKNGKVDNHYCLRSAYILENYTKQA